MLIKLIVGAFERAKSRLTSKNGNDRISTDSDNESNIGEQHTTLSGSFVIEQPSRISLTKWLCTTPASINRPSLPLKTSRVRRSSSWRSLKERGNNYLEHFTSRTLSVDELHRNGKKTLKNDSNKQTSEKKVNSSSTVNPCLSTKSINSINHPVRLVTCDEPSSLSSSQQGNDRSLGKQSQKFSSGNYYSVQQQPVSRVTRQNTNSAGGDSGYSEENFGLIRHSSQFRSLHKSCPHCHCEQRSSLINNYSNTTNRQILNDSSTSDTTINIDDILTPDLSTRSNRDSRFLSTSRSYPHIKPLPKSKISTNVETSSEEQVRRARTLTNRRRTRRRHLSCDSSLWTNVQTRKNNVLDSSVKVNNPFDQSFERRTTNIKKVDHLSASLNQWKSFLPLTKKNHVFGELNLAAIELDSLQTLDSHRLSLSSSYSSSLTSSSSCLTVNEQQQPRKTRRKTRRNNSRQRKRSYLVWHEYKNSSILSARDGAKIFSVVRGDQVRLLRRIGKSTLLVQKEEDGSIGFLPQSCLADDQINSFLSVKGLRETVL